MQRILFLIYVSVLAFYSVTSTNVPATGISGIVSSTNKIPIATFNQLMIKNALKPKVINQLLNYYEERGQNIDGIQLRLLRNMKLKLKNDGSWNSDIEKMYIRLENRMKRMIAELKLEKVEKVEEEKVKESAAGLVKEGSYDALDEIVDGKDNGLSLDDYELLNGLDLQQEEEEEEDWIKI